MTRERSLFDEHDPAAEAAADARAEADVKAGRLVGHDAVKRWVASWGTEAPLPRPSPANSLRKIVWTEEAISHLEAILAYVSTFNPGGIADRRALDRSGG